MSDSRGLARHTDVSPPPLVGLPGGVGSDTGALDDRRIIDGQGELDFGSVAVPTREQALADDIVDLRRKVAYWKGEAKKLAAVDPKADIIIGRLERWQRKCHPKAKIPVDGKRWKVVKARLADGYTAEELDAVIDIASEMPFEQYGRRFAEDGPSRVRRDDLDFLLASEVRVDRLLATLPDPDVSAYKRFVWQALQEMPEVRSVLSLLASYGPHGGVLESAARWARAREAT